MLWGYDRSVFPEQRLRDHVDGRLYDAPSDAILFPFRVSLASTLCPMGRAARTAVR